MSKMTWIMEPSTERDQPQCDRREDTDLRGLSRSA
jgi:hypothetical protein